MEGLIIYGLSYCNKITDVSALGRRGYASPNLGEGNVHTLILTVFYNITNVSALSNVHTLILP